MAKELQMGCWWGSEFSHSCRVIYVDHLSLSVAYQYYDTLRIMFKSCPAIMFVHLSSLRAYEAAWTFTWGQSVL